MKYIHRDIESIITKATKQFPVICLTGSRQTGKSTMLKKIFKDYSYVSLDDLILRQNAKSDPALFLENFSSKTIIDEIQYAPELLPYIKIKVDENRSKKGQFIITGSQVFNLMEGVSESLAGRVAIFELLGFSAQELKMSGKQHTFLQLFEKIFNGFYPDPAIHGVDRQLYFSSYMQTYLERDIQQMSSVHDIFLFQKFIELLASRAGGLLNISEICKECGVSHTTGQKWLSLLERSRIVYLLRPYFKNISKRIVKSPKLYFTDTGLLSYILKYPDHRTLMAGPMQGQLFENYIIIEILKHKINFSKQFELYYYRDSNKNEIDLLLDFGLKVKLIEIKAAKKLTPQHFSFLDRFEINAKTAKLMISSNENKMKLSKEITNVPWWNIYTEIDE